MMRQSLFGHRVATTMFIVVVAGIACGSPQSKIEQPDSVVLAERHKPSKPLPPPPDTAPTPVDTTTLAPVSTTTTVAGCSGYTFTRTVPVATAAQLSAALANVRSGDGITLADGTYTLAVRGTVPTGGVATLCGGPSAILTRGTRTASGYAVWLTGRWQLDGFTVTNAQQGVRIESGRNCAIRNLHIYNLGQEAINPRKFSSHCVIEGNRVHDTGKYLPEYGEAVYIGTYSGAWTGVTGSSSTPDRTDSVIVRNNILGPNVTAEHIDVKEGTTGGVIDSNTFDGHGMVMSQTWVDSWIELKGNRYTVRGNRGTFSIRDGYQAFQQIPGWGTGNVFDGNTLDLGGGSGYGIRISTPGNTVKCNNVVTHAGSGAYNVACSP